MLEKNIWLFSAFFLFVSFLSLPYGYFWVQESQAPHTPPPSSEQIIPQSWKTYYLPSFPYPAPISSGWKIPHRLWQCTSCHFHRWTCPNRMSGWPGDIHPGLNGTCGERVPNYRGLPLHSTSVPWLPMRKGPPPYMKGPFQNRCLFYVFLRHVLIFPRTVF